MILLEKFNNFLIKKLPNILIKLDIDLGEYYLPLSFISKFTNLQELVLSFYDHMEYCIPFYNYKF